MAGEIMLVLLFGLHFSHVLVDASSIVTDDKWVTHDTGVMAMYYHDYGHSENSFEYDHIRSKMAHYPNTPRWVMRFNTFEGEWKYDRNHLSRNLAYFIPPESGEYTFYLVCKTRCQIRLTMFGCKTQLGWSSPHPVTTSKTFDDYKKDPLHAVKHTLTEKYRYCIEVLQKGGSGANNWMGVGVTYPSGVDEIPMNNTYYVADFSITLSSLTRYYKDSSLTATVADLLDKEYFPNSPIMAENTHPGNDLTTSTAKTYQSDMSIYRMFWYVGKGQIRFRIRRCDHSVCHAYVNTDPIVDIGDFTVNFGNNSKWMQFEIFQFAQKNRDEKFELVFVTNKDNWLYRVSGRGVNPYYGEKRPGPIVHGLTSTSLKATRRGLTLPTGPNIGTHTYTMTVYGSLKGSPPNDVDEAKSGTVVEFENLRKYELYELTTDFVGTYIIRSDISTGRTLQDVPTSPPVNLVVSAVSHNELKATWDNTNEPNGIVIGYDVEYAKVKLDGTTVILPWVLLSTTGNTKTLNPTGLEHWQLYAVRVAAKTSVGVGPFSAHVITRTKEYFPVGGAQNVGGYNTSETSLHVTWKHLLEEDTDGIITGYEVSYALDDENNNWQSVKVVGKDTLFVDIPGLEWFADYLITVSGENAVGVGAKSAAITLRTDEWKPQVPPPNVQGNDIAGTVLEITFDNIADTLKIYGYPIQSKIRYTRSDGNIDTGVVTGGVNMGRVVGLNEYTDYDIEVAIQTRRGGEIFSTPIVVKTGQAPPSAPPVNIRAQKLSSTSIKLNCKLIPLDDRNGAVLKYNFTMREKYVGAWETHFVDENDGEKELIVTGLQKWRYYEYIVSGCTSMGCGVASDMAEVRTDQDLPENSPANVLVTTISSTVLNVTWDEVPEGTRRGIINGYSIHYSDTTLPQLTWVEVNVPINPRILLLENLKYFTNYTIKVKAKTTKGYGNFSSEFWMATFEDVPEVHPYNFTCNNATSRSIYCTWEPVPETHGYANGIVRGYNIFYSVMDCAKAELANCNETEIFIDTVSAPLLEHTIEGLENFTEYNIQIELFNGVSAGPKTTVMVIYSDEDIPSAPPANVEGFTETTTSVLAFWDGVPWGEKHGIIIGYVVYYRRMNLGPPSDYLRALMLENDGKRKRRSVDDDSNYEIIYSNPGEEVAQNNFTDFAEDDNDEEERKHSRSRRSLYDGIYIYPEIQQIVQNASSIGTTIIGLEKYQWYTLRVAALTSKGPGPTFDFNVSCAQEVPLAAPEITVFDRFSFDEIRINWTSLTYNQSRGTVFDYNIIYYPVNVHGIDLSPYEQEAVSVWLQYPASGLIIKNLRPYVRYAFQSSALTFAGIGVYSRQFFGETCRCEKYFYTAYRNLPPYFWIDPNTGRSEGIMRGLIEEATNICCSSCINGHGRTIVNWNQDKIGNTSLKTTLKDLNLAVLDDAEFVLPIETSLTRTSYNTQPYISTVDSAGVAIYSRKIEYVNPTNDMMLYATSIIWTFVILFALAVVGLGFLMWILQCNPLAVNRTNQEDFPDDFIHGGGAGVWWAVSSMMRLGYGDVVATGSIGRIFSIPIILLGVVMCSTLISGFCSIYLSYIFTKSQGGVFSKKVVTLENSYDSTVVQRLGGKVAEKVSTVAGLLDALRSRRVDRIAVDSLYGSAQSVHMESDDIIYRGLKESGSAQGLVLGGAATLLEPCFRQYLMDKSSVINERRKAVVDQDRKIYEDDEYSSKRLALARYESDVWMLTIQVCGGLFLGALLIGIIYECRHRKKNKIHANILIHTRCDNFFDTESVDLINELKSRVEERIEKIEVKHAFQRIELITNLRKRVEWLTPDQVNKYKF